MPSFTNQISDIRLIGPVVEVRVVPSPLFVQTAKIPKENLPQPIPITALIDTGASGTVIKEGIPRQLGLKPIGFTYITTASSQNKLCLQYDLAFLLPNINIAFGSIVTEVPLQGQHIQCLIGRDFLSHAVLIYIGYNNSFTLSI
jgi:hypothetical protein